jgi:type II secretory pathway pseudopilin PulG
MSLRDVGMAIVGILLLAVVALSWVSLHEYKKVAINQTTINGLNGQIQQAQLAAKRAQTVQTVTNQTVAKVALQTKEAALKTQQISRKVDVITGQVKDGKINDAAADAAYVSSMLEAYCQAVPTDRNKCSAGQSD